MHYYLSLDFEGITSKVGRTTLEKSFTYVGRSVALSCHHANTLPFTIKITYKREQQRKKKNVSNS